MIARGEGNARGESIIGSEIVRRNPSVDQKCAWYCPCLYPVCVRRIGLRRYSALFINFLNQLLSPKFITSSGSHFSFSTTASQQHFRPLLHWHLLGGWAGCIASWLAGGKRGAAKAGRKAALAPRIRQEGRQAALKPSISPVHIGFQWWSTVSPTR